MSNGPLLELPREILLRLTDFLSLEDLDNFKQCCLYTQSLVNDHNFWHRRFIQVKRNGLDYPRLSSRKVNWKKVARDYEAFHHKLGRENTGKILEFSSKNAADIIDAIHLPKLSNDLLVVGNRGRSLLVYSLPKIIHHDNWHPLLISNSHKGWIWSIKSYENDLVTGSWDSTFVRWHLSSSNLQQCATYKLQTPVLCSNFITPNSVIIGTYNALYHLDLREPSNKRISPVNSYHKNSILCVETVFSSYHENTPICNDSSSQIECEEFHEDEESLPRSLSTISLFSQRDEPFLESTSLNQNIPKDLGDYLQYANPQPGISFFTGCKDKSLCAWDLRAPAKPLVQIKLNNYPRLMSLNDNSELWVCEPPDVVHLFDVRHRNSSANENELKPGLNLVTSSVIPSSKCLGFGCLKATPTCLFLGLLNGDFGAYYPGSYTPLATQMDGSPLCVDYSDECLAVGSGIGFIHLWMSRNRANRHIASVM